MTMTTRMATERRATKLTMMATMMTVAMGNDDDDGDGATYPVRLQRALDGNIAMGNGATGYDDNDYGNR
jgi:hypothetical protein